jgi:hypothetical protein
MSHDPVLSRITQKEGNSVDKMNILWMLVAVLTLSSWLTHVYKDRLGRDSYLFVSAMHGITMFMLAASYLFLALEITLGTEGIVGALLLTLIPIYVGINAVVLPLQLGGGE